MIIYADLRWPSKTGIGAVQSALLARVPTSLRIIDLQVSSRIGSPLSPVRVTGALRRQGARAGVFWSPGYMPPLAAQVPVVVTVHDLTHLRYYTKLHAFYYNTVLRRLYRRCRAVICVSEYTRHEFLEWSGMAPERVFTVHNGVAAEFLESGPHFGLDYPYVFYPGNRRSYKNLDRLLTAYASSALPREGIHLVLTGDPDDALSSETARLGVQSLVHCMGFVSDRDLIRVYRGALAVAFVSLYEGFGLPIIEAMATGVPVLTSNVSAMPEVAGHAALLVDPTSVEGIAHGLERVCFDRALRESLVRLGRQRAQCFDWDRSAAQVWRIVAEAAGKVGDFY